MKLKKILSIFLIILLSITLISFYAKAKDVKIIRIVFTNDIHGHITASGNDLGLSRFAAKAKELNADLILDAGDLYHGLAIATITNGESVAKAVKAANFDAMTAGNHDWNFGQDKLKELESLSQVPILCSNVIKTSDGTPFFENSVLIKDIEGIKVGVFGVIDQEIYSSTAIAMLNGLEYANPVEFAKKAVEDLKNQGCKIIICLNHTTDRTAIAKNVSGIDVVITGHEHVISNDIINGVRVVQAGTAIQNFCYIDIEFDNSFGNVTGTKFFSVPASQLALFEPDAEVQEVIDEVIKDLTPLLATVIGKTPVDLESLKLTVRSSETNLTRIITDAYRYTANADIAFENAGGVRDAVIKAGGITYGDVVTLCPFGNFLVSKNISGSDLLKILNRSYDIFWQAQQAIIMNDESLWPDNDGSGLHISGITYCYDPSLESGERVWNVKVNNEAIDLQRIYTVAMSNFVADLVLYPEITKAEISGAFYSCEESIREFIINIGVDKSINDSLRMQELSKNFENPSPDTGYENTIIIFIIMIIVCIPLTATVKKY